MFNPVGQIVGQMNEVRPVREVDLRPGAGVPGSRRAAAAIDGGRRLTGRQTHSKTPTIGCVGVGAYAEVVPFVPKRPE